MHAANRNLLFLMAVVGSLLTGGIRECQAVEASPHLIQLKQPDGTEIKLYLRGNEYQHWYENADGYTVVKDADLTYKFASGGEANGERAAATPSNRVVGRDAPLDQTPKHLIPAREGLELQQPRLPPRASPAALRAQPSGRVRNLVVLIRFSNHTDRTLPTPANFDVIFNHVGAHVLAPTGSVRDAYLENSFGKLDLQSTVATWVTLPKSESYYANGDSGLTPRIAEAITDGLNAVDTQIDFKQFDEDHDGFIDAITFVHSGYGAEWGGADQDGADYKDRIWSHRWVIPTWTSAEGVRVADYHINPALWSTSGNAPGRIGVICHETGHFFGLPDLYDTSQQGSGIGSWCLMANSWGFDQTQLHPPHMSAWCKMRLGWLTPTAITAPGHYTADAAEAVTSTGALPRVYRISQGYGSGEYLLVENRQPKGIESDMPQGGLAIWHIDENASDNTRPGFPGQSGWPTNGNHYMVALLQADGNFDLEHGNGRGDGGDVYHAGGRDRIDGATTPNTNGYRFGTITANVCALRNISAAGDQMTFDFGPSKAPAAPPTALNANPDSVASNLAAGQIDVQEVRKSVLKLVEQSGALSGEQRSRLVDRMLQEVEMSRFRQRAEAVQSLATTPEMERLKLLQAQAAIGRFGPAAESPDNLNKNPVWQENHRRWLLDPRDPNNRLRVWGGRPALPGEFPHCVAIGRIGSFCCTGTVIGPKAIVTAAHCIVGGCGNRVYVGLDSNHPDAADVYNVVAAVPHPEYDSLTSKNDIALVIVDRLLSGVTPAKIVTAAEMDAAYACRVAGYGLTEFGGFGVQMTVDVVIATADGACGGCDSLYGCHPGFECVAGGNGVDTCNGDSGGPAYVVLADGSLRLAGATSRATRNSARPCGDGGIYTRVDKHQQWLNEVAQANSSELSAENNLRDSSVLTDAGQPEPAAEQPTPADAEQPSEPVVSPPEPRRKACPCKEPVRQGVNKVSGPRTMSSRLYLVAASTRRIQGTPELDLARIDDVFRSGCAESNVQYGPPIPDGNERNPDVKARGYRTSVESRRELLDRIANNGPEDMSNATLVCYLKLHGKTVNEQHVMECDGQMPGGRREEIRRIDLCNHLRNQGARLTVLITESCARSDEELPILTEAALDFPTEVFRALFVESEGFVDLNSATYRDREQSILNQLAWMNGRGEGVFTEAFAECFLDQATQHALRQVVGSPIAQPWDSFLEFLKTRTDEKYLRLRQSSLTNQDVDAETRGRLKGQDHQYPFAIISP